MSKGARNAIKAIAFTAVGGLLLVLLAQEIEAGDVATIMRGLDGGALVVFGLFYLALAVVRALRFRFLLARAQRLPLHQMTAVALVHGSLSQLLPFRLGELSYPLILRSRFGLSFLERSGDLVAIRVLDVAIVMGLGAAALLIGRTAFPLGDGAELLLLSIVAAAAALLVLPAVPCRIAAKAIWLVGHALERRVDTLLARLASFLATLAGCFDRLGTQRFLVPKLSGMSLLTYAMAMGSQLALLQAVGVDVPLLWQVCAVSVVMASGWISLSIAGVGFVHAGWVLGLTVFADQAVDNAIATSMIVFAVNLIAMLASGVLGLAVLLASRPPTKPSGHAVNLRPDGSNADSAEGT